MTEYDEYLRTVERDANEEEIPLAYQPGFELFHNEYNAAISEISTKLEILASDFEVRHDYSPIHHIVKRLKTAKSIEGKLKRLGLEVSIHNASENIFDIAGIRVICNFIDDVYQIEKMLLSQSDIELNTRKDYIANPKPNGYRSLHLGVYVPVFLLDSCLKVPVEIQLRTVAMDFWASLEHQLRYKQNNEHKISEGINYELKACAEMSAELDQRMQKIFEEVRK